MTTQNNPGSFSAGTLYHNVFTWGENQGFCFSKGYNPRLTIKLEKNSLKNQRTIGIRIQDDNLHGWAFTKPQNELNQLELRPIVFDKEQASILYFQNSEIVSTVPVHGQYPIADTELAIKKYVDDNIRAQDDNITALQEQVDDNITALQEQVEALNPVKVITPPHGIQAIKVGDDIEITKISCNPVTGFWLVAGYDTNYDGGGTEFRLIFYYSKDDGQTWRKSPYNIIIASYYHAIVPNTTGEWTILYRDTECIAIVDIASGIVRSYDSRTYYGAESINAVYNPLNKTIYYVTGQRVGYSKTNGGTWTYSDVTNTILPLNNILCCNPFSGHVVMFPYEYGGYAYLPYIVPHQSASVRSLSVSGLPNPVHLTNIVPTMDGSFWFKFTDNDYVWCSKPYSNLTQTDITTGRSFAIFPHYYSNTLIFLAENQGSNSMAIYNNGTYQTSCYGGNDVNSLGTGWLRPGGENVSYSCNIRTGTTIFIARYSDTVYKFI